MFSRAGYTLVRCPECGLVFQDPQPSDEVLSASYYHDPEFARSLSEGEHRATAIARARDKLEFLRSVNLKPGGRTLDVGCASGEWLDLARGTGWDPVGIEIGEHLAALARGRDLEVHTGTLETVANRLPAGSFALITFWDVLEHLRDPLGALRAAVSLLAPEGRIALGLPNVEGWYPRATHRLFASSVGIWEYPELPVHLFDFSPRTASRLLQRVGLTVERVVTAGVPFSFYGATTLRDQLSVRPRGARLLSAGFRGLRWVIYPAARLFDRGNYMLLMSGPADRG